MKKERFLELLNLYLDDELNPNEVESLFSAINDSDEYRCYYDEYCLMSQACSNLPADFPAKRTRLGVSQMVYAFGGMAAALALVFLGVQNTLPLFETGDAVNVVSDFSVNAESGSLVIESSAPELTVQVATVSSMDMFEVVLAPPAAVSLPKPVVSGANSSSSWRQGLIEKTVEGSSLDHEMQLVVLERDKHDVIFEKSAFVQELDTNRFSGHLMSRDNFFRTEVAGNTVPSSLPATSLARFK